MSEPNKVEQVSREVIERQLLTALNDKSQVAILATEEDLDLLIAALRPAAPLEPYSSDKAQEFCMGLQQLKREAFGR